MERSQIHRVSVADQVASILRQRILKGELRPGMPLQEVPLAASLGVSRNTMREATRILSLEGLLTRSIHRGVARDAERSCQRDFLEWHSRAQLAFQNPLTQDGRDLIRDTDPVNLRALHENVDWERNAKSRAILLPLCSRCQVLNNSTALCESNSHRAALAVIRRPECLRRRTHP